jgi:hypothetical protein
MERIAPRLVPQPNGKQKKLLVPSLILLMYIQDSKRPAPRRLLIYVLWLF